MFSQFAIFDLSTIDLIVILVIILLLFGATRLPALSRSLGESAKELRKGLKDDEDKKKDNQTPNSNVQ